MMGAGLVNILVTGCKQKRNKSLLQGTPGSEKGKPQTEALGSSSGGRSMKTGKRGAGALGAAKGESENKASRDGGPDVAQAGLP